MKNSTIYHVDKKPIYIPKYSTHENSIMEAHCHISATNDKTRITITVYGATANCIAKTCKIGTKLRIKHN